MAPRLLLAPLAAVIAPCDGTGARIAGEAAEGFAEAMRVVVIVMIVIAAIVAVIYAAIWVHLIRSWRRGQASKPAAVVLVAAHVVALVAAGTEPEEPALAILRWTAVLPALALGLAFVRGWPGRAGLAAVVTAGMWLLPAEPPRIRRLPAPIVDLAVGPVHACAVLANGEVVCVGDAGSTCREPRQFGPGMIEALGDADAVAAIHGLTCVRHRAGPVRCCGDRHIDRPASTEPWPLPIGGPGATLVVTQKQVLAQTGDQLQGWPNPLPEGLAGVRAIAGEDAIDVHLAAVDHAGVLWIWRQAGQTIERLARFPGVTDAEEVAVHGGTGACVRRRGGAVSCFPWPDSRDEPFEVAGVRAEQLVALDDSFDSFCAREVGGAVTCWTEDKPPWPHPELRSATRLVSVDSALCDVGARARCVQTWRELDGPLEELLALPVAR